MPRPAKPPHLVWIKPRHHKETGKLLSNGYWAIKHGTKLISTGLGYEFLEDAQVKRHEYEATLYAKTPIVEHGKGPRDVLVVDLIRYYLQRKVKKIEKKSKDKRRDYLQTMERLITFWDGLTVYDIHEDTLKEYQEKSRAGKPLADSTARRELEDLKAAVMYGARKRVVELDGHIIDWELPPPGDPRDTFYSEEEVADLVRAAYRTTNKAIGGPKGHKTSKHLARFILIAARTGTRADKIEKASYKNIDGRPWMDTKSGIFYRSGVANKSPMNKRADPVRIPNELLHQVRRWEKEGSDNVIEYNGKPGGTKSAFRRLKVKVLGKERAKTVNRHTLKHTCASWLMKKRVPMDIIAKYLSTTKEVIEKHYGHFHPDFHQEINEASAEYRISLAKARRENSVKQHELLAAAAERRANAEAAAKARAEEAAAKKKAA